MSLIIITFYFILFTVKMVNEFHLIVKVSQLFKQEKNRQVLGQNRQLELSFFVQKTTSGSH